MKLLNFNNLNSESKELSFILSMKFWGKNIQKVFVPDQERVEKAEPQNHNIVQS